MTSIFAAGVLRGRRILITSGGTGLGKSMGGRFLELGAGLVISSRRARPDGGRISGRIAAGRCDGECSDLRDPEAAETMIADLWKDAPLDVLVNNAAATFIARTHKLSPRAVDAVLRMSDAEDLLRWSDEDRAAHRASRRSA